MRISDWSSDVCSSDLLDAGGDHVAEHALGEERRLVPQREGDEDEASKRGELELDDGDEELDRQDEEGEHDHEPGEHQHEDRHGIVEESGETEQVAGLLDQRIGGLEARAGNEARTKQLIRRQAGTRCLQPEAGERLEDDVCKDLPVVRSEENTSELQSL